MTPLHKHTDKHASLAQAAKALKVHATQLTRWLDAGALADDSGDVYIKTKGKIQIDNEN